MKKSISIKALKRDALPIIISNVYTLHWVGFKFRRKIIFNGKRKTRRHRIDHTNIHGLSMSQISCYWFIFISCLTTVFRNIKYKHTTHTYTQSLFLGRIYRVHNMEFMSHEKTYIHTHTTQQETKEHDKIEFECLCM